MMLIKKVLMQVMMKKIPTMMRIEVLCPFCVLFVLLVCFMGFALNIYACYSALGL